MAYKLSPEAEQKLELMPPEERALATAEALWLQGYSYRKAAKEAGVEDHTQIWRRVQRNGTQRERVKVREVIEPLALAMAEEAGKQTLEALSSGEVTTAQLPVVFGIATDKLERLNRMEAKSQETPLSQLFGVLEQGGRLTIEGPGTPATSAGSEAETLVIEAESVTEES